ncbi:MAG: PQQ-binding-like beta-propeller repeat protein [Spirochaetes bacterium]|nr:PQQ-binding-like beta-propeller repeat protein [Spirochaetota bacterium]
MHRIILFTFILLAIASKILAGDWPIYKGNLFFTGNNDEIIVSNNQLKWLFLAKDRVFNPVVSDGRIYFVDKNAFLYCIDEDSGNILWLNDIRSISSQFKAYSKSAGKIKYPLVYGNTVVVSDPIAIYAFDKKTGKVIWARTGLRVDETKPQGLTGITSQISVDGIYADPIIDQDLIYYGTRKIFASRDIRNGHIVWENKDIATYSGFPVYYDQYIITQSMNYETKTFTVFCLEQRTGKVVWQRNFNQPVAILPPVVNKNVYVPLNNAIYCLNIANGQTLWQKTYNGTITSPLSFTDRSILFSLDNASIVGINPENGNTITSIFVGQQSSPYFVTIRDVIYIAYNQQNDKNQPVAKVKAIYISGGNIWWEFTAPFPGGVSQPVASDGILFLPAGNYLYAIGAGYIGNKGLASDSTSDKSNLNETKEQLKLPQQQLSEKELAQKTKTPESQPQKEIEAEQKPIPTRKLPVEITNDQNVPLKSKITIHYKGEDGNYNQNETVNGKGDISIPDKDNVELIVESDGHVPKKVIINKTDKYLSVKLDQIQPGKAVVVDNIHFDFDKWYIRKDSINILDKLVEMMKVNPHLKVEVWGHTDSIGDDLYNQKLSEKRADAVCEYIIKHGISPERISAKGFGETKPIASNDTKEGRQKNRRTEFYFKS